MQRYSIRGMCVHRLGSSTLYGERNSTVSPQCLHNVSHCSDSTARLRTSMALLMSAHSVFKCINLVFAGSTI